MADLPVNSSVTELGIYLYKDSNITIENVSVFSPLAQPIRVSSSNGEYEAVSGFLSVFNSQNITVKDSQVLNTSAGVSADNSNNLTFEDISMTDISGNRPFFTYEVNNSNFISNTLKGYDNDYMFQSWKGNNDIFSGNVGNYASQDSIWAYKLNDTEIINNTFSNCPLQSILETSGRNDTISGNTVFDVNQAIILDGGSGITVNYNKLYSDNAGIGLDGFSHRVTDSNIFSNLIYNTSTAISSGFGNYNNVLNGNIINDSRQAIYFSDSPNNTITSNIVYGNSFGIQLYSSPGLSVYNNYFSNSNNAYSDSQDYWNTTPHSGLNILGGDTVAGNYWSNYHGHGANGIGQSSLPYSNDGSIHYGGDFYPLVSNTSFSVEIGSVNSTYKSKIYVPVYLISGSTFINISMTVSFNSNLLTFAGVERTLASDYSELTYRRVNVNTVSIKGTGIFESFRFHTVLFYMVFGSIAGNYTTEIKDDYVAMSGTNGKSVGNGALNISYGWTNIGPENIAYSGGGAGEDMAFKVSKLNPEIMYTSSGITGVYSFGGFFYSRDGGKNWFPSDLGLNGTAVQSIALSPYDPLEVVVITNDFFTQGGAIYKSMNGGLTWQETYNEGGNQLYVSQNGTLYAATFRQIMVSYDFGSTWKPMSPLIGGTIHWATFLNNATYIEIGVSLSISSPPYSNNEIQVSDNGGKSFATVLERSGGPIMVDIAVDPVNEDRQFLDIFAGYNEINESLYFSSDMGQNWTVINESSIGVHLSNFLTFQYVCWDPYNQSIVFLGGDNYLLRSVNGGKTFQVVYGPIWDTRFVEFSPINDTTVYEGSDQGLYVSYDLGSTWHSMNNRSSSLLYGVVADGRNVITSVQDYAPVYYNGSEWTGVPISGIGEGGAIAVDPYNLSIVILESTILMESRDGGDSFSETSITPQWTPGQSGGILFQQNGAIFVPGSEGIYVSRDEGSSWSLLDGSTQFAYSLASDPLNSSILYASNASGLFISRDGGTSWQLQNSMQFTSIAALENGHGIAGMSSQGVVKVFISENYGLTFRYANISSPAFGFIPPNTGGVYSYYINQQQVIVFASNIGLYFSDNYGQTWVSLNQNIRIKEVTSFYYSPNGTAYISTYGAGVYFEKNLFSPMKVAVDPQLTAYLPLNSTLLVDNITVAASAGYSTVSLHNGSNSIRAMVNGRIFYSNITAVANSVYFLNFSALVLYNYSISFTESGLPSGTAWYLNLSNGQSFSSTTPTISFNEVNGSYTYTIGTTNKIYSAPGGSLTVNGSSITETVKFSEVTYEVTFTETGLPSGTSWSVTLNGTTESSTGNISFSVPNGTYSYSVAPVQGYSIVSVLGQNESSGSIKVSGYSVDHPVTFEQIVKEGYFAGTVTPLNASIFINGTVYLEENGQFNISLPPGAYEVKITAPGYSTYTTSITISSSAVTPLLIHSLSKVSKPSSFPISDIAVIAVVVLVIAAVSAVSVLRTRKRK